MNIDETSVLVIDDDAVSRELLTLLLSREGYLVRAADSGNQALQDLGASGAPIPHVILVDLQMPGINGVELAAALSEICGGVPALIAMSGSLPHPEAVVGYNTFLLKPFTIDQFAAAVHDPRGINPTHAIVGSEVIVPEIYSNLSEKMPPEKLEQLYFFCLEDAEKRISIMRQAAAEGDDTAYRLQAHAIKGGCAMVGAFQLQTLAATMENLGLADNHVATLDQFLLASARLKRMLNARAIAVT